MYKSEVDPRLLKTAQLGLMLFILILAADLRFTAIDQTTIDKPIRADAMDYFLYTYNITHHFVYSKMSTGYETSNTPTPDSFRSPGFPLFAALIMGKSHDIEAVNRVILFQTTLSLLVVVMTYYLASVMLNRQFAILAALMCAISPHLVSMNTYFLTESLFTSFIVLFFFSVLIALQRQGFLIYVLIGIILGYTTLIRPTLQYFLLFFIFWVWTEKWSAKHKLKISIFTLVGFVIIFGSWSARNLYTTGELSDSALKRGTLQHGMYPNFTYQNDPRSYGMPYRFDPNAPEHSKDMALVLGDIAHRFQTEPLRHLKWYFLGKPISFWSWDIVAGMGDIFVYPVLASPYQDKLAFKITHTVAKALHWPLIIFSLIASVLVWLPVTKSSLSPIAISVGRLCSLLLLYFILIHIVGAPFPRYSIPLRPLNYIMASFSLFIAIQHIRRQKNDINKPHAT